MILLVLKFFFLKLEQLLEIKIFLSRKSWYYSELRNFENKSGYPEVGNLKIWGYHDFRISLENIFWEIWKIWSVSFKFPRRTEPTRERERTLDTWDSDFKWQLWFYMHCIFFVLMVWFDIYFLFWNFENRGIKINWAGTWNLKVAGTRKRSVWPLMGKIHWLKDFRNCFWNLDNLSNTRRPRTLA